MIIEEYDENEFDGAKIRDLLISVYVDEGFTDREVGLKLFSANEVKKRGKIITALSADSELVGMVICCNHENPYRQVANKDETEMQLLAVKPNNRGQGIGRHLCSAFENSSVELGFSKFVLFFQ